MAGGDSDTGDLLMKMVLNGTPIDSGGQTVLPKNGDKLGLGFKRGSIMEIQSFSLRCGTKDTKPKAQTELVYDQTPTGAFEDPEDKKNSMAAISKMGGYQEWRAGNSSFKYPLDIQPVTFERTADLSSAKLLQGCINKTTFDSATIIKRKPVGSLFAGEVFLRFDFTGVLINKIEWSDEDNLIKEKISFITRAITFSYRQETSPTTLGPIVESSWQMTVTV